MSRTCAAVVAFIGLAAASPVMAQEAVARENPAGCVENFDPGADYFPHKIASGHSAFWSATYHGHYKVLTAADTENAEAGALTYVLVQCGTPEPELSGELEGALVLQVPVDRTIVTHRNVLAMLDEIGRVPSIVGLANPFFNAASRDAWYAGIVGKADDPRNVGLESELDYEMTLSLEPDVIFMAGYGPDYGEVTAVSARGLPAVMVSNRTEPTPLGSSEWLKFVAAFYNEEATANSAFETIEKDYTAIAEQVRGRLSGDYEAGYACLGDEGGCGFMYAHGDRTLNGQILRLMGVNNPFAEGNDRPNGMEFDYESALGRTRDTDFLIIYYAGSPAALESDPRYGNVPALASGDYIISTLPNYDECNAVTYVRVDRLVRDYAIGMLPEMFLDEEGTCFRAPRRR